MTEDARMDPSRSHSIAMFLDGAAKRLHEAAEHAREGKPVAAELGEVLEHLALTFAQEATRGDDDRWFRGLCDVLFASRSALQFEATRGGFAFQGDEPMRKRGRNLAAELVERLAADASHATRRMQKAWADMVFRSSTTAPMGCDDSGVAARAQEVRDLAAAVHDILTRAEMMTEELAEMVAEQIPCRILLHCHAVAKALPDDGLDLCTSETGRLRVATAVVKCLDRPAYRDRAASDEVARAVVRSVLRSLGLEQNTVRLVFDADRKKLKP